MMPDTESYCLFCEKEGHRTTECYSTQAVNTPAARELWRLATGAVRATPPEGSAGDVQALREALAELVACKDLKKHADGYMAAGPWMDSDAHRAALAEYERRRPLAWEAARRALAAKPTEPSGDVQALTEEHREHVRDLADQLLRGHVSAYRLKEAAHLLQDIYLAAKPPEDRAPAEGEAGAGALQRD